MQGKLSLFQTTKAMQTFYLGLTARRTVTRDLATGRSLQHRNSYAAGCALRGNRKLLNKWAKSFTPKGCADRRRARRTRRGFKRQGLAMEFRPSVSAPVFPGSGTGRRPCEVPIRLPGFDLRLIVRAAAGEQLVLNGAVIAKAAHSEIQSPARKGRHAIRTATSCQQSVGHETSACVASGLHRQRNN